MDYGYAPAVEMEYGGYVEPPAHIKKSNKAPLTGLPAEQRPVPDYDYSLFRYSRTAVPFLLLIIVSAAVLQALTWWQGPWGFERGVNGASDGIPKGFNIKHLHGDAGVKNHVRNLRWASFVIGIIAVLIVMFAIRSELSPGLLKVLLLIAAILVFAVFVLEAVAFGLSIDDIADAYTCEPLNYPGTPDGSAGNFNTYNLWCEPREALELATTIADIAWSIIAFLFFWALIFTTLKRNWAWGPGKIAVAKSPNRPRVTYPPPSPFTHIHETRRLYVWVLLIAFLACLVWDFTLSILMHQERVMVNYTDNRNYVVQQGWNQRNNAYRLALTFLVIAFALIQLMNLATWKRRWVSYTFGLLMFLAGCAAFVVFAIDVSDINDADDIACPNPGQIVINLLHQGRRPHETYVLGADGHKVFGCPQWEYAAVAFLDFWLAFILCVWAFVEFFIRSNFSWSTFYFYADSEWLRNHSIFLESTDREAYDWKRFTMETGRDYFYSPSLGISTVARPRNYIEPDVPLF
jgi:hypothetical protein